MQDQRIRVLFLVRQLNHGGAERQLVALAKGLCKHGHQVAVAVFYPDGPLEKDLHESGVLVRSLNKRGRWDILSFIWRLINTIRDEQPDIIHSYLNVQNILTAAMRAFYPSARVVWGVRASNMDLGQYDWLARLLYPVECLLSRFADLIVANSYAGMDYAVVNGFPKEKMIVIPNGIDTERFCPDPRARGRVRAAWGIGEETRLIGIVARLDPMKDHETFLRASAFLALERKQLAFVCVGTGPEDYRRKLVEMSEQLGLSTELIWTGARGDIPAIYNALDVTVSSSSFGEGFSNVIAEAMACGAPCVTTDVGDSAWIVGETGWVVPPRDVEALKTAIAKCLDRLDANGRNEEFGRQRIIERFSIEQLEARTEESLLKLCRRRETV